MTARPVGHDNPLILPLIPEDIDQEILAFRAESAIDFVVARPIRNHVVDGLHWTEMPRKRSGMRAQIVPESAG